MAEPMSVSMTIRIVDEASAGVRSVTAAYRDMQAAGVEAARAVGGTAPDFEAQKGGIKGATEALHDEAAAVVDVTGKVGALRSATAGAAAPIGDAVSKLREEGRAVDEVAAKMRGLAPSITTRMQTMRDVSSLITAVTIEASVAASAILALQASEQHLADTQAQLAALRQQFDAGAVDPDQLTRLLDTVSTTTAQLSAAIPANTAPATVPPALIPAVPARPVLAGTADRTVQARDAAATTVPVAGTDAPAAPGAFAQPTETATAGLAAAPGAVTPTPVPS